mmetsp:Transcript_9049/g.23467  ORF Transcript_9049/g.23467 Transcript_9049/m.23467 type:complete len:394 (+) Transcript_9049:91-1272(+)
MPPKHAKPVGAFADLPDRGIKMYYETSGPNTNKAEFQGENERLLFMILGSAADLRKTADQQYINQSVSMFKILTYDHRNTGQTTIKDEPCTMEDYADDAAALLQAVVPEKLPVFVIGISFGGMVAQHLAIRHPHLISKLVLCCCPTGGEGGMAFPIHEWYAPGHAMEDRVVKKIFQANTDRNEEWKEKSPTEWQMTVAVLSRDEKVGVNDPLRMEGTMRQLEARKEHNTWDKIGQLRDMDVLVCGSDRDNITPVALMRKMVDRIGGKVESKLDFGWGHSFIAADTAAMPYVNEWLRRDSGSARSGAAAAADGAQIWKVVGGADKGGILVRAGEELSSAQLADRLGTDSLVEQVVVKGDRMHYRLRKGSGPNEGWVAIKLKDGKELVVKTDEKP